MIVTLLLAAWAAEVPAPDATPPAPAEVVPEVPVEGPVEAPVEGPDDAALEGPAEAPAAEAEPAPEPTPEPAPEPVLESVAEPVAPVEPVVDAPPRTFPPGENRWAFGKTDGSVGVWGHLREIVQYHPNTVVDADGNTSGEVVQLDQRVRVGFDVRGSGLRFAVETDVITGRLAGGTWNQTWDADLLRQNNETAYTLAGFLPRRASLSARIGTIVQLEGGLMPAHNWGLGMLANGGEVETRFGRVDRGDRMLRMRVALAPFHRAGQQLPLFVSVGYDRVVEDDTARWWRGQQADHFLTALLWNDPDGRKLGLFYTYRTQREETVAPRPTDVSVIDLYGDLPIPLAETGWTMRLALEAALITGTSERILAYASPTSTEVLSGGLMGKVEFQSPKKAWAVTVDTGYSSATGDPDAGASNDFTFDDNINAGLVIFDEVIDNLERGLYATLSNPDLSGSVPDGADLLITGGSVRRAAYVNPSFQVHATPWMDVRFGYVGAWSTGPIANAFTTFRAGGEPRNHLDQVVTDRTLGHELDAGFTFGGGEATKAWPARPSLGMQGGVAFLGDALGGGIAGTFLGTLRLDW